MFSTTHCYPRCFQQHIAISRLCLFWGGEAKHSAHSKDGVGVCEECQIAKSSSQVIWSLVSSVTSSDTCNSWCYSQFNTRFFVAVVLFVFFSSFWIVYPVIIYWWLSCYQRTTVFHFLHDPFPKQNFSPTLFLTFDHLLMLHTEIT